MRIVAVFIVSIFAFLSINIVTGNFESHTDGFDRIGFPFEFYLMTGGKCIDCDLGFKWFPFLADVLFFLLFTYLIGKGLQLKLLKKNG